MKIYYTGIGSNEKGNNIYTEEKFIELMKKVFIESNKFNKEVLDSYEKEYSKKKKDYPATLTNEEYKQSKTILRSAIKEMHKVIKHREKEISKMKTFKLDDWIAFSGAEIIKS